MVSVCMATQNGERFLKQQLDSILPQLASEDELIISDDSSTDSTALIIDSYRDKRIKLLRNPAPKGIVLNFEHALKHASGDFIFLADQDDVWERSKVEKMKKELERADLVVCDCYLTDHLLKRRSRSFFHENRSGKGLLKNIFRNSYMGCCMAFRRSLLLACLPFPSDLVVHDLWIGLVAERHFRIHFLHEPLVWHRRHTANATTTGEKSFASISHKLYYRYQVIRNLFVHKRYAV